MGARLLSGAGTIAQLGALAHDLGFRTTLLVVDAGLAASGIDVRGEALLRDAGLTVHRYDRFGVNPDSAMVEQGRAFAASLGIDSIVALGGGSALDAAKGINFLLTNGGRMQDYRGYGKAARALLPSIGVPTTAGTGSEAQSYCVIADAETHMKMACGDPSAAFRGVILDPDLTTTAPKAVRAAAGIDAAAHAIETTVTTRRTPVSRALSREAWRLIEPALLRSIESADDGRVRADMMLGAHFAGAAIEASMLGAAHACANPLTARYGTVHGAALAVLLPHVIRWNAEHDAGQYAELGGADHAAALIEHAASAAGFPATLRAAGAAREHMPELAAMAATQWTGTFNPRQLGVAGAIQIYERAF
ncbi:MAG: iron-containing alcohol dehydrogenase [Acidobacteriota bacterium]|nr:iron-containing alcohol dehydrogenase [Acidobacteriota bacterium]